MVDMGPLMNSDWLAPASASEAKAGIWGPWGSPSPGARPDPAPALTPQRPPSNTAAQLSPALYIPGGMGGNSPLT